jgi:uncharacterized RDD family membrane protein YckC
VARLVDAVVVTAVASVIGAVTGFGVGWLAATALGTYLYFVAGDVLAARTLGKALFGLRVASDDGRRPEIAAAARRESFVLLGAVPFAGAPLALVAWAAIGIALSKGRLGFHDRIGHTTVVADIGDQNRGDDMVGSGR